MTAFTSPPAHAPRPTGRAAVLAWLMPFVAVGIAMVWHWLASVPPGPLPPPVAKEPPPAKKAPEAAKGDDDDDKDRDGFEPFTTPRTDHLLAQLHRAYDGVAFKSEPTFEAWSAAHRPLITQIVTATRTQTFKGVTPPPSVSTSNVECHTIRCRFTLSSTDREHLQTLLDALATLKIDDVPLWYAWKHDKLVEEPAKRPNAKPRVKTVVTVSFSRDLPKLDTITLAGGAPLRPANIVAPRLSTDAQPGAAPQPTGPATAPAGAPTVPKDSSAATPTAAAKAVPKDSTTPSGATPAAPKDSSTATQLAPKDSSGATPTATAPTGAAKR